MISAAEKGLRPTRNRLFLAVAASIVLLAVATIAFKGVQGPYVLDSAKLTPITDHVTGSALDVTNTERFTPRLFGRIVSTATFVLEAKLSGGTLHKVVTKSLNIVIHIACGALLLVLVLQFLRRSHYRPYALPIAFFTVALWLLAPANLGTAFYAVQRMAQLAALFTITGLIAYMALRSQPWHPIRSPMLAAAYILSLLLAFGSKETGANLLLFTALAEFTFFHFRNPFVSRRTALGALFISGSLFLVLLLVWKPQYFDFSTRAFTMVERLLTQFRILPSYVQDLLLPMEHATGLYLQFTASTGLFQPITTFFGLLGIAAYIGIIILAYRRGLRLVGFGLAFYAVGHLMESTILPLELHFLHRNYLPSIGLYLALVAGAHHLGVRAGRRTLAVTVLTIYIAFFATASYARAVSWGSKIEMGAAAYHYNPQGYRAATNYSRLLVQAGQYETAFAVLDKAIQQTSHNDFIFRIQRLYFSCLLGRRIPGETYAQIASASNQIPNIELSSALKNLVVGAYERHRCANVDVQRLVAALGRFAESKQSVQMNRWYVHYYRARLLRVADRNGDANLLLRQLIDAGYSNAGLMLADHYLRNGETKKAEQILGLVEERFSAKDISRFGISKDRYSVEKGAVFRSP